MLSPHHHAHEVNGVSAVLFLKAFLLEELGLKYSVWVVSEPVFSEIKERNLGLVFLCWVLNNLYPIELTVDGLKLGSFLGMHLEI